MAKRKATATQKLRRNIKREINRLEKTGYIIDDAIKEKIKTAPYQTLKSYQRSNYKRLYKESIYVDPDTGEIMSGTAGKSQRRKIAAEKAAETRKKRATIAESQPKQKTGLNWQNERARQDQIDLRKAQLFQAGQIILSNINDAIEDYPGIGSKILSNVLQSEIRQFGRQKVAEAMANAPDDVIASAREIVYYEGDQDKLHSAIMDFIDLIRGTIPDDKEAKETGDNLDELTDMSDDYED